MSAPYVAAVASGKGGVGKTLISAWMALRAAATGRKTLLIDADMGLANAEVVLGVQPKATVHDWYCGRAEVRELITPVRAGLDLVSGGSGFAELASMQDRTRAELIRVLRDLAAPYDTVVLDTAAGIGENVLFFAASADRVVVVLTPDPTSLTDAYALVKVLSREWGVRRFSIVINQADELEAKLVFRRLVVVADRYLDVVLEDLGSLPPEEALGAVIKQQKRLPSGVPEWIAERLDAIADRCLEPTDGAEGRGGLRQLWERTLADALMPRGGV